MLGLTPLLPAVVARRAGGGGPGGPPPVLAFNSIQFAVLQATADTATWAIPDVGDGSAGRIIVGVNATSLRPGSAPPSSASIGGVPAAMIADGGLNVGSAGTPPAVQFFAANVPSGTSADFTVNYAASVFWRWRMAAFVITGGTGAWTVVDTANSTEAATTLSLTVQAGDMILIGVNAEPVSPADTAAALTGDFSGATQHASERLGTSARIFTLFSMIAGSTGTLTGAVAPSAANYAISAVALRPTPL